MKYGISFRDPTSETASELRERAAPLDSVVGKTIALMDIGKMRGDEFIDRLEQLCTERGIETRRYKKPTNTRVAPREMIKDIADNCDAVIIALSDCGSCTSCSTHDLNDLDKKGLAGVSVLTTEFQQAFEFKRERSGSTLQQFTYLILCRTKRQPNSISGRMQRWTRFSRRSRTIPRA
ncbi:UGSC family (seleno)protein [Bradyrhizobium sp. 13971]